MEEIPKPQKSNTILVVILVALVLIFILAFLLLDFHILRGQANASSQVSTYTFSIDEDHKIPLNQNLYVYVRGGIGVEDRLAAALMESLVANPYIGTVEIQHGDPHSSSGSVLIVDLAQPNLLWTPFYSRADIEMEVAYASDGQVDWIDQETVNLTNGQPVIRLRGDYQMQASAAGLMSMPGFNRYLAQQLADQIAASLMERLTNSTSN